MAYNKNTWKSGDVVTSAKLNNIENGIAGVDGMNVVLQIDDETMQLPIKAGELYSLCEAGALVRYMYIDDAECGSNVLVAANHASGYYEFSFGYGNSIVTLTAATADDYPAFEPPEG